MRARSCCRSSELAQRFRLEDVGHSAGVFDIDKLAWVNRHYLKAAAPERLARLSLPYLRQHEWVAEPSASDIAFLERDHSSCSCVRRSARADTCPVEVPVRLLSDARAGGSDRACRSPGVTKRRSTRLRKNWAHRTVCSTRRRSARPRRECASVPARRGRRCFIRFAWCSLVRQKGSSSILLSRRSRRAHAPGSGIKRILGAAERAREFASALNGSMIVYGINPVLEALRAGRVKQLWIAQRARRSDARSACVRDHARDSVRNTSRLTCSRVARAAASIRESLPTSTTPRSTASMTSCAAHPGRR